LKNIYKTCFGNPTAKSNTSFETQLIHGTATLELPIEWTGYLQGLETGKRDWGSEGDAPGKVLQA
jgi:hypothetical protein